MLCLNDINYSIRGEGQPVLLLNIQFQRRETWSDIVNDLQRYYKVINVDFPNQWSSKADLNYKCIKDYAASINNFLKMLNITIEDTIIFGYSFGAHIIRVLNLDLNISFKSIIIGGIDPIGTKKYYIKTLEHWAEILENHGLSIFAKTIALRVLSPEFISKNPFIIKSIEKKFIDNYKNKTDSVLTLLKSPINYYKNKNIIKDNYSCPVHMVVAENDTIMPSSYVKNYAKSINAKSIHILEKSGHQPIIETPFELKEILDEIIMKYEE